MGHIAARQCCATGGHSEPGTGVKWTVRFLHCFHLFYFNQLCLRPVFGMHNKREKVQRESMGLITVINDCTKS